MRDVDYVLHKGTYRFKALTAEAKEYFARLLEMPEQLVADEKAEIFITGVAPDKVADWLEEMRKLGMQTEKDPPPPPGPPPVELWTF